MRSNSPDALRNPLSSVRELQRAMELLQLRAKCILDLSIILLLPQVFGPKRDTPVECALAISLYLPWSRIFSVPLSAGEGYNVSSSVREHRGRAKATVTHCAARHRNIGVKLQLLIAVSKLYEAGYFRPVHAPLGSPGIRRFRRLVISRAPSLHFPPITRCMPEPPSIYFIVLPADSRIDVSAI